MSGIRLAGLNAPALALSSHNAQVVRLHIGTKTLFKASLTFLVTALNLHNGMIALPVGEVKALMHAAPSTGGIADSSMNPIATIGTSNAASVADQALHVNHRVLTIFSNVLIGPLSMKSIKS